MPTSRVNAGNRQVAVLTTRGNLGYVVITLGKAEALESVLTEPFAPDYNDRVSEALDLVAGKDDAPPESPPTA
jgi:hypothetical protein